MWPLLTSLAAAAVTALGIAAARRRHAATERLTPIILALAAGVLVSAALVHLTAHALETRPDALFFVLLGFAAFVVIDRAGYARQRAAAWTPVLGIALHSFLDGLTYTAAFEAGGVSGATVALGMILHELPEGVIVYALLASGGIMPARAGWWAFAAAGLTTPLGVLVALPVIGALPPSAMGTLTALVAGILLYVGASHLLPRASQSRWSIVAFAVGTSIALATSALDHG